MSSSDIFFMPLHCVSAKSVFHKDCSCSCNESSCIRMKFTCIASLFVLEAGPINDHPSGSFTAAGCFAFTLQISSAQKASGTLALSEKIPCKYSLMINNNR